MNTLGSRIKWVREREGISQQMLADAVGVSRAAVSQWENGQTKGLRPENLIAVAEQLNSGIRWLVLGDDRPPPDPLPGDPHAGELDQLLSTLRLAYRKGQLNADMIRALELLCSSLPRPSRR
jgi:transcriptional regulator with XRE-family HTH domain